MPKWQLSFLKPLIALSHISQEICPQKTGQLYVDVTQDQNNICKLLYRILIFPNYCLLLDGDSEEPTCHGKDWLRVLRQQFIIVSRAEKADTKKARKICKTNEASRQAQALRLLDTFL